MVISSCQCHEETNDNTLNTFTSYVQLIFEGTPDPPVPSHQSLRFPQDNDWSFFSDLCKSPSTPAMSVSQQAWTSTFSLEFQVATCIRLGCCLLHAHTWPIERKRRSEEERKRGRRTGREEKGEKKRVRRKADKKR